MQPSPGTAAAPKAVLPRLSHVQTVGCPLRQGLNWPALTPASWLQSQPFSNTFLNAPQLPHSAKLNTMQLSCAL